MVRGRSRGVRAAGSGIGAVGLLLLSSCSGGPDTTTPDSNRACAVVQAKELSKITGDRLKLEKAGELPGVCRFRSEKTATAVDLAVTAPVEAGSLALQLDMPKRERNIGDEAWSSTTNTALGFRMLARQRGAMLSIDLDVADASNVDERNMARTIAKAGLPALPKVAAAKPSGARGAAACKVYATKAVADALGGKPEVSATQPPGSCQLTVPDNGLTVTVSILAERADKKALGAVVASAPDPELTDAAGMPSYWIPIPGSPGSGGQLDVLAGDTLRQVSVIGSGFEGSAARDLAITIAKLGFGSA